MCSGMCLGKRAGYTCTIRRGPEHPLTLNHLGILAEHVEQDLAKAAARYRKVASLGDVASQANFGYLYRSGQGVDWDSC